jgi:hypothetical protein
VLVVPCSSYRRSRGFDVRVSLLSILVTALACSAERPPTTPRQSPAASAPKPRVVWSRFAEIESWPVVGEPFTNSGHVGAGAEAVVRVSPDARAAYEHLVKDTELPDGAVAALFHELAPGRPGPVYVMEKGEGVWRFSSCRADGTECTPAATASTAGCQHCHADAVADSLFGLPRRPVLIP